MQRNIPVKIERFLLHRQKLASLESCFTTGCSSLGGVSGAIIIFSGGIVHCMNMSTNKKHFFGYTEVHHDRNKSAKSRKIKPRPLLQCLSKKLEHAIPYGIDIPDQSTNMPQLPRPTDKLLQICSEQNKRSNTACRAPRSNIEPEITRCQATKYSNKTTHKNSAVKFTENTEIQKRVKAIPSGGLNAKNGLHNKYSVNLQKLPRVRIPQNLLWQRTCRRQKCRDLICVITDRGCWQVISHKKNPDGYTQLCRRDVGQSKNHIQLEYAHRLIYFWWHNIPVDNKVVIRHVCDNPLCINPRHLISGTQTDNMRDRWVRTGKKRKLENGTNQIYLRPYKI